MDKALDVIRHKRLGLLTPDEIREVRKRTGISATDMAEVLGIGEKTYTRWENGKSIQNKSNDTLIRILDKNAAVLSQLEAERSPDREQQIRNYLEQVCQPNYSMLTYTALSSVFLHHRPNYFCLTESIARNIVAL